MTGFSPDLLLMVCAVASCLAVVFSAIAVMRGGGNREKPVLDELARLRAEQADQNRDQRRELAANVGQFQGAVQASVQQLGDFQKERLETVTRELASLTQRMQDAQNAIRQTMESRLDTLRSENMAKLEEMRKTVDEKLQTTLEKRLSESFLQVRDQLDRVHKGLGEMQSLASGVGDLKKVLTNIKTRGIWGEMQLGNLLEQFLAPDQYIANAQVKSNTGERVEFAIRLPGRNGEDEVLLPIDAKFPQEDYERLITASEQTNHEAVAEATTQLEETVRRFAKAIADKYLNPPATTDFAILFLPTESLYAEMLRRAGFFEKLQRDYHVTLAGPSTLTALLNALQMGFRSLAIEKRSSEVWQVLGAVRTEFNKYGDVVNKLRNQLQTAANTIDALGTRTKQMGKRLGSVDSLPAGEADALLGFDKPLDNDEADEPETEIKLVGNK